MEAGKLKYGIKILQRNVITNEYNEQGVEYVTYRNTKAQVIYKQGNKVIENDEIIQTYNPTFVIRYYIHINETMLIEFKNDRYRILSIIEDIQKQNKTIYTEKINE